MDSERTYPFAEGEAVKDKLTIETYGNASVSFLEQKHSCYSTEENDEYGAQLIDTLCNKGKKEYSHAYPELPRGVRGIAEILAVQE